MATWLCYWRAVAMRLLGCVGSEYIAGFGFGTNTKAFCFAGDCLAAKGMRGCCAAFTVRICFYFGESESYWRRLAFASTNKAIVILASLTVDASASCFLLISTEGVYVPCDIYAKIVWNATQC